jgi:hypothetical protein
MSKTRPNVKNSPKWQKLAQMAKLPQMAKTRPNGENMPELRKIAQMAKNCPN